MFDLGAVVAITAPVLAAGAAFGGVKVALNGTRERVVKLERSYDEHQRETIDRLARIEEKVNALSQTVRPG